MGRCAKAEMEAAGNGKIIIKNNRVVVLVPFFSLSLFLT